MLNASFVYILTNKTRKLLYIGVTSDLRLRLYQHKHEIFPESFTARYKIKYLIYYEIIDGIENAIDREKQLKRWSRIKKEIIIAEKNKNWKFLNREIENDIYSLDSADD